MSQIRHNHPPPEHPRAIVRQNGKYITVMCPIGHVIESHKINTRHYGGSALAAELGARHWRKLPDRFDRLAATCDGAGHNAEEPMFKAQVSLPGLNKHATQPSLFGPLPRAPRRKLAHVIDAGVGEVDNVVLLRCARCGWESGWTTEYTVTESKRGIPCPRCNP